MICRQLNFQSQLSFYKTDLIRVLKKYGINKSYDHLQEERIPIKLYLDNDKYIITHANADRVYIPVRENINYFPQDYEQLSITGIDIMEHNIHQALFGWEKPCRRCESTVDFFHHRASKRQPDLKV